MKSLFYAIRNGRFLCWLLGCTFIEDGRRICYCTRCHWRDRSLSEQYDWETIDREGADRPEGYDTPNQRRTQENP